jgi:aryl-phospho-beta-D-glucosidase BglC (GH1 family)
MRLGYGWNALVAVVLLGGHAGLAQGGLAEDLAARRAQHLRRGINTSMWFAQSPWNYSVERLRSYTTLDDIVLIHKLGFDHIRLSVDADPLTLWQQGRPAGRDFMAELDTVVAKATGEGLSVIVDVHPESKYKQTLLQGTDGIAAFVSLWKAMAEHFKGTDPNLMFFEMMNEPEQTDAYRWAGIESTVAEAIRQVAPKHTIIAAGARWSGLTDLLQLAPIGMENVIYTFHDYEPFAFTHQGATWTMQEVRPLRGVPYPSSPEAVAPNLAQEPTMAGQWFVEQYGLGRWDAARLDAEIAFAERWGKMYHVPVYCGEFGVHKPYAKPEDRARWTHDMRLAFEKHGIGWAMWDYQANFGVVTKNGGVTTPDREMLEALGVTAADGDRASQ